MRHADPDWLALIRTLPCIICRNDCETEACHIKMADSRFGKGIASQSKREDDWFVLPMCGRHHREQHAMPERQFYEKYGIDAPALALSMYVRGRDYLAVMEVMRKILGW